MAYIHKLEENKRHTRVHLQKRHPFGSLSPCSLPNTLFCGTGDMMNYDQYTHIVVFIKFSDERSNNTGNNHTSTYIRSVRSAKN